jgi:cytochrome c oxidase subunit IV
LLIFPWLCHSDSSPDSHRLSPLSFKVVAILFILIFLVDYVSLQGRKRSFYILSHIQLKCFGWTEVFPMEFGVFVLPSANLLPLN